MHQTMFWCHPTNVHRYARYIVARALELQNQVSSIAVTQDLIFPVERLPAQHGASLDSANSQQHNHCHTQVTAYCTQAGAFGCAQVKAEWNGLRTGCKLLHVIHGSLNKTHLLQ
jgi:hypothetical protein